MTSGDDRRFNFDIFDVPGSLGVFGAESLDLEGLLRDFLRNNTEVRRLTLVLFGNEFSVGEEMLRLREKSETGDSDATPGSGDKGPGSDNTESSVFSIFSFTGEPSCSCDVLFFGVGSQAPIEAFADHNRFLAVPFGLKETGRILGEILKLESTSETTASLSAPATDGPTSSAENRRVVIRCRWGTVLF